MCISAPFSSLGPDGAMADNSTHPILEILQSFSTSKTLYHLHISLCYSELKFIRAELFLVDMENQIAGNFTNVSHKNTTELRYFSIYSAEARIPLSSDQRETFINVSPSFRASIYHYPLQLQCSGILLTPLVA